MSFSRYPAYKDSGVEWLGDIPSDWDVCALSYRYEVALGKMLDEKRITGATLAPYLRNTDVQWDRINTANLPMMDFAGADLERFSLKPGDLLVCEGGEVGRAAIWNGEIECCFYQKALHRLRARRPTAESARYLFYVLRAAADRGVFSGSEGRSTIAHLTAEALRRYRFPFPPSGVQQQIAAFLDRETAKIDSLVAEQEKLIRLLKEKQQVATSQAVTKGFGRRVPVKSSKVEWIGQVPENWKIVPVRSIFRFVKRQNGDNLDVLSVYRDYGVVYRNTRNDNVNRTPEDVSNYQTVLPGDLVINKMKCWQGSLGVSTFKGITSPDYAVFAPVHNGCSEYLNWLFRCMLLPDVYRSISNGIRPDQWRLEPEKFEGLRVPYPPKEEQHKIAQDLRLAVSKLEALTAEAGHAISLFRERRSAIISAAVTGKIDVRGLLPDVQRAA